MTKSTASPLQDAMIADLQAVAGAVSVGNPDAKVTYVANFTQSLRMTAAGINVITTNYVPSGTVGAIDAGAVALIKGAPVFAISNNAVLHMESATPLPLSATGSPNTVSAPMRSTFQEDLIALRCVLRAGWAKRRTAATAIVTGVAW